MPCTKLYKIVPGTLYASFAKGTQQPTISSGFYRLSQDRSCGGCVPPRDGQENLQIHHDLLWFSDSANYAQPRSPPLLQLSWGRVTQRAVDQSFFLSASRAATSFSLFFWRFSLFLRLELASTRDSTRSTLVFLGFWMMTCRTPHARSSQNERCDRNGTGRVMAGATYR